MKNNAKVHLLAAKSKNLRHIRPLFNILCYTLPFVAKSICQKQEWTDAETIIGIR